MAPRRGFVRRARAGIALAGVLYLLVIIAFLAAAGVLATTHLRRGASLRLLDAALTTAADDALAGALVQWPSEARASMPIGAADTASVVPAAPVAMHAAVRTTRLSETTFWIVADVQADAWPQVRRRANLIVRVRPPPYAGEVALVSRGDVVLGPAARLLPDDGGACDGGAGRPPATAAGTPGAFGAVALVPDARLLTTSGRDPADSIRVVRLAASDSLLAFGDDEWRALVARADTRLDAGAVAAAAAHPLVYAAGDLTLQGGDGHGVLLVEGRLTLAGPLSFAGLVMARGGVVSAGDGTRLTGLVVAAAPNGIAAAGPPVALSHAVEVRASRCATERALVAVARPVPVHGRAWAELF